MPNDLKLARKLIKECQKTQNLELDLGNCGIEDLNDLPELFECTHLESLILSDKWPVHEDGELIWGRSKNNVSLNTFNRIPPEVVSLQNLTELIACGFHKIELMEIDALQKLRKLEYLDLSGNNFSDYGFLEHLTKLKSLALRECGISNIDFLKNLSSLQFLYLSSNKIRDINPIKKLTRLQTLYLSYNTISDYTILENLRHLKFLGLSETEISDFSFLEKLTSLQSLYLRYNNISDISFLEKLTRLKNVDLRNNLIKEIPSFAFSLKMTVSLVGYENGGICVENNPVESPPLEIIKQGKQSALDWFEAAKKKLNEIKIILIGDPKAGKTSLLRMLKENEFEENEIQTDGINIEHIKFGECNSFKDQMTLHELTAHFWDFGGQEIMNATHQFFLTNRSVYLLVLDARKDADVAGQIRQWVKRVKATGGNSPIVIIANQVDVNTGFGFSNETDLKKEFSEIKYFIKVSCKTGQGIELIKERLEELIPKAELFNTEIDKRWMAIKEQLQEETKSKHYLDETRFNEICSRHGLNEKTGRLNAINFLHDLGLVLHFNTLNLAQYYVLDPYWITYGVYQIVTSSEAGRLKGIVGMDRLEYIVNEEEDKKDVYISAHFKKIIYDTNQRRFLVDILKQFKLCFYLPDNAGFIIPNLLDTTEPTAITEPLKKDSDSIRFVYKYEYLPTSILPNIMVEEHTHLVEKWRTGCVIEYNNCQALISIYQNVLTTTVSGEHKKKREFMAVIRHCIDTINKGLAVKPQMLIPLPETTPIAYAEYEVLLNREKKGRKDFIFNEDKPDEKPFEISKLLEGIAGEEEMKNINLGLKRMNREIEEINARLDRHYTYLAKGHRDNYLAEGYRDNQKNDRIIAEIKELNTQQTAALAEDMMRRIAVGFDLFGGYMDDKLKEVIKDLKKTDDLEAKLKLSIPLVNLLGIEFGMEWDVKSWASKMYDKYKLHIFKLMI